jgi:GTP-binding protein Era
MNNNSQTRCGFVAVVGEPNSGKSTFVNAIVGEKISIISKKPQTTRRQVRGIAQYDGFQIILVDTPGFFKGTTSLEKAIINNLRKSYRDVDITLVMIDATRSNLDYTFSFIEKLSRMNEQRLSIIINKVDISSKNSILKIANKLSLYKFIDNIFMISAITKDGLDDVIEYLKNNIPESPNMYDVETKTDMEMIFRLSEITREKLFKILLQELPYSLYVETEVFREAEKKARIYQSIVVVKDSQKGIILGRNGERIKSVKEMAIQDMRDLLGKKVDLKLFVKVKENWTEKRSHLQNAGIIN